MRLFVNVDHVATIREARKTVEPDPLEAAILAEKAGADGITVHLREDRRHIQDLDVQRIRRGISTPMNLEMAAVEEMVRLALEIEPHQVSLVPENRLEITTEGGLDVIGHRERLIEIRDRLKPAGILFSLFVDPDRLQIDAAKEIGADSIEINTGSYSECREPDALKIELEKIRIAAGHAAQSGLRVFAGHGLTRENVGAISAIESIEELNIGHHIVSRAVFVGMQQAVEEMLLAMRPVIK